MSSFIQCRLGDNSFPNRLSISFHPQRRRTRLTRTRKTADIQQQHSNHHSAMSVFGREEETIRRTWVTLTFIRRPILGHWHRICAHYPMQNILIHSIQSTGTDLDEWYWFLPPTTTSSSTHQEPPGTNNGTRNKRRRVSISYLLYVNYYYYILYYHGMTKIN